MTVHYLYYVTGQLRHMGPDCQLLKISVAPLMDGGRLVSGCDRMDPGGEGLPACLSGFEADYWVRNSASFFNF